MAKIFISHATVDAPYITPLVDLLQTQFNLTREDFYYTSDEQISYGDNWIEDIRNGMQGAQFVIPIITPSYMESQFCLCELGATWVNKQSLVPVIIPPLDHNALTNTPYRSWMQAITLNSETDLLRLAQAMKDRGINDFNSLRYGKRAEEYCEKVLKPFIERMKLKKIITNAEFTKLEQQNKELHEAYELSEQEVKSLTEENSALRKMKDAEEIKVYDRVKMGEWENFIEATNRVYEALRPIHQLVCSILFHGRVNREGYSVAREDLDKLQQLQDEGFIVWSDGFWVDEDDPRVWKAIQALNHLEKIMDEAPPEVVERFEEEYPQARYGLKYSNFWSALLGVTITHSTRF